MDESPMETSSGFTKKELAAQSKQWGSEAIVDLIHKCKVWREQQGPHVDSATVLDLTIDACIRAATQCLAYGEAMARHHGALWGEDEEAALEPFWTVVDQHLCNLRVGYDRTLDEEKERTPNGK